MRIRIRAQPPPSTKVRKSKKFLTVGILSWDDRLLAWGKHAKVYQFLLEKIYLLDPDPEGKIYCRDIRIRIRNVACSTIVTLSLLQLAGLRNRKIWRRFRFRHFIWIRFRFQFPLRFRLQLRFRVIYMHTHIHMYVYVYVDVYVFVNVYIYTTKDILIQYIYMYKYIYIYIYIYICVRIRKRRCIHILKHILLQYIYST
jgi:hypothetical protein